MEKKVKHLEFLQGIVNRLATDSFRMKGWSVVLVSALFVLLVREEQMELALVGLIPILVFGDSTGTSSGRSVCFVDYTIQFAFSAKIR